MLQQDKPKKKRDLTQAIKIANILRTDYSFTTKGAAVVVGNLMQESHDRIDPAVYNSEGGGQGAFGILQWRGVRLKRLKDEAKKLNVEPSDLDFQIKFLVLEMSKLRHKDYNQDTGENIDPFTYRSEIDQLPMKAGSNYFNDVISGSRDGKNEKRYYNSELVFKALELEDKAKQEELDRKQHSEFQAKLLSEQERIKRDSTRIDIKKII